METAEDVLMQLKARGVKLRAEGGHIGFRPARLVPKDMVAKLWEHKSALLALLSGRTVKTGTPAVSLSELMASIDLSRLDPPAGARLYFGDANGRPCGREEADHWTWEGGPAWLKASEFPVP
jgi:hypothetical protein